MKKMLLTLVILLSGFSLYSQDNSAYSYKRKKTDFVPEHDVRIGIGTNPVTLNLTGWNINRVLETSSPGSRTLSDKYNYNLIRRGPKYTFGALSAAYTYRPFRWFELGMTVSYVGEYRANYYNDSEVVLSRDYVHDISLIPTFRFIYYSSEMVRLYSKIGIGVGICVDGINWESSRTFVTPAWELTLFGISVGRKLFGYAEVLSFGATGLVSAGIGYRFK